MIHDITKETISNILTLAIVVLLTSVCFFYFTGDDTGTSELIDRVTDHNTQAGAATNRAIEHIDKSRETLNELGTGLNRGQELIRELQNDNARAKQIIERALRSN